MGKPFRYSYKATAHIKAEKEEIWKTLTDLDNYHLWNSFTPKVETNWEIGDLVKLTVQMKNGKKPIIQMEYLSRFIPYDEFAWGMNWGFFLKAERIQLLTSEKNGQTKYFTEDIIEGMLSPIVHMLYGNSIQKGFESLANSLKNYIENL